MAGKSAPPKRVVRRPPAHQPEDKTLLRGLRQALDLLMRPVLLFDAQGALCFANRAALALGGEEGPLRPLLALRGPPPIGRAALAGLGAEGVGVLDLNLAGAKGARMVICALEGADGGYLVLGAAPLDDESTAHLAARLVALLHVTATEARVAALLCQGHGTAEVAARMGIAPTTLAFHLRNMYRKMNVTCQSALVAALLGHPASLI